MVTHQFYRRCRVKTGLNIYYHHLPPRTSGHGFTIPLICKYKKHIAIGTISDKLIHQSYYQHRCSICITYSLHLTLQGFTTHHHTLVYCVYCTINGVSWTIGVFTQVLLDVRVSAATVKPNWDNKCLTGIVKYPLHMLKFANLNARLNHSGTIIVELVM